MAAAVWMAGAVEGITDEALLRRVCRYVGAETPVVYGKNGKDALLRSLAGYNNSARFRHWAILIDLDDAPCAPDARRLWLPHPSELMCFRIVVRELESWLLADGERIADFIGVDRHHIPGTPDNLDDPKESLLDIVRRSRRRHIREDMLPRPGSGQNVGPAYASRLIEFLQETPEGWRPEVAVDHSDSLRRCIRALERLTALPYPPADPNPI